MRMLTYVNEIMHCENSNCDEDDHERHHQFISSPEMIVSRERRRLAFGCGVISQKKQSVTVENGMLVISNKPSKVNTINNIELWTEAFAFFSKILLQKHASLVQDLFTYMSIIRDAISDAPFDRVYQYDRQFRLRVSLNHSKCWFEIDGFLWLKFIAKGSQGTPNPVVYQANLQKLCYDYNFKGFCQKSQCFYRHNCMKCSLQHPALSCVRFDRLQELSKDRYDIWKMGHSPINIEQLELFLKDYPNEQNKQILFNGFKFGFSLNYHGPRFPFDSKTIKSVLLNPVGARYIKFNDINSEVFVTIMSSKTDQIGCSTTLLLSSNDNDDEICVVKTLKDYLQLRPDCQGQIFCHLNHNKLTRFQF
ncbi:unnamed protein product [Mytilus coruscus]|uniref:C3H1-type domain-containing protein n=1 Tax=Mytilus coruscus TaxID=42192 RepID=A0A6J7ZWT1_MYTCO|nr:unnamed protein product [Mytilus coruscus]